MSDRAVSTYPSTIKFVSECFMTQKMCDRVAPEDHFLIVYCPDKYITQRIYDEAVGNSLTVLKLIPDWFVTSKLIKYLYTALYTDKNILYFNSNSGNVVFYCNEIDILNIDLNNIDPDNNFDEDDPDTITLIRLLA